MLSLSGSEPIDLESVLLYAMHPSMRRDPEPMETDVPSPVRGEEGVPTEKKVEKAHQEQLSRCREPAVTDDTRMKKCLELLRTLPIAELEAIAIKLLKKKGKGNNAPAWDDTVHEWLSQYWVVDPKAKIKGSDLMGEYNEWAGPRGYRIFNAACTFSKCLTSYFTLSNNLSLVRFRGKIVCWRLKRV